MQRYNLFNTIHKGLRAQMYNTALALQQTYFADAEEAEAALQKVEATLQQLEHHAHNEDTYLLPAITFHNPWMATEFEEEHAQDQRLCNQLTHLINIFRATTQNEEKSMAGSAIAKAFMELMIFNLQHMAKEELVLNNALWQLYSDDEIRELHNTILINLSPQEKSASAQWIMRGINKHEAINWLKGIRRQATEPDFWNVYALTKTELPVHRRIEVQQAVLSEVGIY